jgi:hypothetical protein
MEKILSNKKVGFIGVLYSPLLIEISSSIFRALRCLFLKKVLQFRTWKENIIHVKNLVIWELQENILNNIFATFKRRVE